MLIMYLSSWAIVVSLGESFILAHIIAENRVRPVTWNGEFRIRRLGWNPFSFIDRLYVLWPNPLVSPQFPLCKMKIIFSSSQGCSGLNVTIMSVHSVHMCNLNDTAINPYFKITFQHGSARWALCLLPFHSMFQSRPLLMG